MCPAVVQENTISIYVQCVFEIAITTGPMLRLALHSQFKLGIVIGSCLIRLYNALEKMMQ